MSTRETSDETKDSYVNAKSYTSLCFSQGAFYVESTN